MNLILIHKLLQFIYQVNKGNDKLILNKNIFFINNYNISNENDIMIENISINSKNSISPQIVINNLGNEIGLCDNLILDARNSYNLGVFNLCFTPSLSGRF